MKHITHRFLAILLTVALALSLLVLPVGAAGYEAPASVTVTAATADIPDIVNYNANNVKNAYVITSYEGWEKLASLVNSGTVFSGKTIYLTTSLNMSGKTVTVNGTGDSNRFQGVFDGQGYTIDNVTTLASNTSFTSLFGFFGGTVKNLVIGSGCNFTRRNTKGDWRSANASLIGSSHGTVTVQNVISYATVADGGYNLPTAGIVGYHANGTLTVSNSTFAGTITNSPVRSAGIVGYADCASKLTVTNCVNEGNIIGKTAGTWSNSTSGGIVGQITISNVTIENCVNKGVVQSTYGGGIVGSLIGNGRATIKNCSHYVDYSNIIEGVTATNIYGIAGAVSSTGNAIVPPENADSYVTQSNNHVYMAGTDNAVYEPTLVARGYQMTESYTKEGSEVYSVRFIATGNDLSYQNVGFIIKATTFGKQWDANTTTVYESLSVNTPNNKTAKAVTASSYNAEYLFAMTIADIPVDTAVVFYIQPYAKAADGTLLYGDTYTGTINKMENFEIVLGNPIKVAQGTVGDSENYNFPYFRFTESGAIVASWKMSPDSINSYTGNVGYAVSEDKGKTWTITSGPPQRISDVLMSNGKYFHGFEAKNALTADYIDEFASLLSDASIPLYSVKAMQEAVANDTTGKYSAAAKVWVETLTASFKGYEYNPQTDRTESFDVKVHWEDQPLWLQNTNNQYLPLCQSFALHSNYGIIEIGGTLYYTLYTHGFGPNGEVSKYFSVYIFKSTDNGRNWYYHSQVTPSQSVISAASTPANFEGFGEPMMEQMPDGSVVMLMRTGNGLSSYITRSTDGCKTWSTPTVFASVGVLPQIMRLDCGVTLATYGRPGLYVSATNDPAGLTWGAAKTVLNYTAMYGSCYYTALLPLDACTALMIYSDYYPNGNVDNSAYRQHTVYVRTITVVSTNG